MSSNTSRVLFVHKRSLHIANIKMWVSKPLLSNPYGKAISKIAWSFKKLVCSSWSAAQLTLLSAAYTLDGITYFCIRNITNTIIKTGSWLGMGTLWICLSLKCTITGLFSGCKFCVEVMLMCKYNLFIVIYKNGYRELWSLKSLFGALHMVFTMHKEGCVWCMKKREIGLSRSSKPHFVFCSIPKLGPEVVMCLLGSSVHSKRPDVKEWGFCTSVQSCPLQHPAGVAMVTSCNLAFTYRNRHSPFRARCIS